MLEIHNRLHIVLANHHLKKKNTVIIKTSIAQRNFNLQNFPNEKLFSVCDQAF